MALEDDVIARLSVQRVNELTNPQNPSAATLDTTRLARAVDDVEAEFQRRTGIAFDDTNAQHVALGVQGVVCRLKKMAGEPGAFSTMECEEWNAGVADYAQGRFRPVSNSVLEPSSEPTNARPDMDRSFFSDLVPKQRELSDRRGTEDNG